MLVRVVFLVAEREARFLLHAQYAVQLQIMSLVLVARWFAHADDAAAIVHEAAHSSRHSRVLPFAAAGVGRVAVAHIDEHVHAVQHMVVARRSSKLMNRTSNGAPESASITPA